MKVMIVPIVIGAFGTITKRLLEGLEDLVLYFDLLARAKMPFQGDAPEGSDTFQWQLWEEIAWAEIGWWNGTR